MACKYFYKGHKFNSEIDLDNFLLTKEKFYLEFGDIVFDAKTKSLNQIHRLNELKKENSKLWNDYKDLLRTGAFGFDEDGDPYIKDEFGHKFKYIGVSKFLSGHKKRDTDEYYFPYFDDSNYFNERKVDWANNKYNDKEILILFNGDPNTTKAITDSTEINDAKKKIKTYWEALGRAGDAIHEVMLIFFSNDDNDKPYRDLSDTELFNVVKSILAKGNNLPKLNYNGNADDNIRSCIAAARQIYELIKNDYGDNCTFFPEYLVNGTGLNNNQKPYNIFGKIDLLIIDSNGTAHIFDYKTSTKEYTDFSPLKKSGYTYLLVTYTQMLKNLGIDVNGTDLSIIPLHIKDFTKDSNNNYQFNGISYSKIERINAEKVTSTAFEEIEYVMPSLNDNFHPTNDDAYKEVTETIAKMAPGANPNKTITEESTAYMLEREKVFDKKNDEGNYEFTMRSSTGKLITIYNSNKEALVKEVFLERLKLLPTRSRLRNECIKALKFGIKNETTDCGFPKTFANRLGSATWIQDTLAPYCNKEWEVKSIPALEDFDIITLYNTITKLYDFITISTNDLTHNIGTNNRKSLLYNFETDALAELKFKKLTLEALNGNVELIQTLLAINATQGFENGIIGRILVINPYNSEMLTASNELLLMNFNALTKYIPIKLNNFDNGNIKLANFYDLLESELLDIWTVGENTHWKDSELRKYKDDIKSCKSIIDEARDKGVDDKIQAVLDCIIKMKLNMSHSNELEQDYTDLSKLLSKKIRLFNTLLFSLAELKGIHFRLQTTDHNKWYSSIAKTLKEGQSGNYLDNPGNLDSETLNLITSLIKEANQNIREDILKEKIKLDKLVSDLKRRKGFSYLKENIGFNQAELYKPLYERKGDDIWFKKVDDVSPEYKPLLEYILITINKNRFNVNEDTLKRMAKDPNYEELYYRVPLAKGGFDSLVSVVGLKSALISKLKYLNPLNWAKLYDDMLLKLNSKELVAKKKLDENLIYSLENYFDEGEKNREQTLKRMGGVAGIELNAETLVLKHIFAYSLKEHIDNVFPLILAASAHLNIQAANLNTSFKADKTYFEDYIRSKIKKESIVDPNLQGANKVLSILKLAASKMTLAFTPVQMLYLPLQGLWVDISLMIRKPDGKLSFTFENFKNSLKIVYGDLFNFSGKPTLCSLINEYYALNDMDINKYIDNITHNKKGFLYNFSGMAYKFASRPDFYNRMAIFLSLMLGDGCLKAHSVVNGKLVYDWTKDKRFSKFAANPKDKNNTDPEYIKQRSLYYAIARQLVNEGAKDENGDLFVLDMNDPKPLPKAYTTKQAESHKSLADDIYGYYSEENKSLILATALGSMWLLFKTFWSGKKNLYLLSGGIRMRGTWEPYIETKTDESGNTQTIEYFYDIKADGSVDYNKIVKKDELPPNKLLAPVVYWKGLWQEGIAVTMSLLLHKGQIVKNYQRMMLEDPDMARCYLSNILQLGYDLTLWLIGGALLGGILAGWLKKLLEENKDNKDFLKGCELAAANVAVWTVRNSFMDFNFFESIGSPLTSWTPFAIQYTSNTIKSLGNFAIGDLDLFDTIVKLNGYSRQLKPMFDAIKPELFRTKQEGGTWESATARKNREKRENQ